MTADDLALHFNRTFQLGEWPTTFPVDFETYGQVAHELISRYKYKFGDVPGLVISGCDLSLGPNGGLLFKNVELLPTP